MQMMNRLWLFLGVLVVAVLASMLYLNFPLLTGQTIQLATRPVDPFDVLRGQYIAINYEISSINTSLTLQEGQTVYILLRVDDQGIARPAGASSTKPTEGLFIKGNVKGKSGVANRYQVAYGIEQYFFERDASFKTTGLVVEAKVDGSGRAMIARLLLNGEPVQVTYPENQ